MDKEARLVLLTVWEVELPKSMVRALVRAKLHLGRWSHRGCSGKKRNHGLRQEA